MVTICEVSPDPHALSDERRVLQILSYALFLNENPSQKDPCNFQEADQSINAQDWKEAMDDEMESFKENDVLSKLMTLPQGAKTIGTKWIYKTKTDSSGSVVKYKARLVAQGFNQRAGLDYKDTFAPVVRMSTLRTVLTIAATLDWSIQQYDVKTAFLYGDLEEDVYIKQPMGYHIPGKEHMVYKLKKSLYGLKQAPRQWNKKLDSVLQQLGLKPSVIDPCLYCKVANDVMLFVCVFVDDLVISSNSECYCTAIFNGLSKHFQIVHLGDLHYCLGITFTRNRYQRTIHLSQEKYTSEVLKNYGMKGCNGASTPMAVKHDFVSTMDPSKSKLYMERCPYQQAIGSLMYLSLSSRPDITLAVSFLSCFNKDPNPAHWNAVKHVLQYLEQTKTCGLVLGGKDTELQLSAFADANHAPTILDRRSTSGYTVFLGKSLISWRSCKQSVIAQSTAEAEYYAIAECMNEVLYTKNLLTTMTFDIKTPIKIHEDNQSCIAMAKNPIVNKACRQIDIKYHAIREQVKNGVIVISKINSKDNVADILTKPLPNEQHQKHTATLRVLTKF